MVVCSLNKRSRNEDVLLKLAKLAFIEVKARTAEATTITATRNEILTALNKPHNFILAICQVENGQKKLRYIRRSFQQEPDFGTGSFRYSLEGILPRSEDR